MRNFNFSVLCEIGTRIGIPLFVLAIGIGVMMVPAPARADVIYSDAYLSIGVNGVPTPDGASWTQGFTVQSMYLGGDFNSFQVTYVPGIVTLPGHTPAYNSIGGPLETTAPDLTNVFSLPGIGPWTNGLNTADVATASTAVGPQFLVEFTVTFEATNPAPVVIDIATFLDGVQTPEFAEVGISPVSGLGDIVNQYYVYAGVSTPLPVPPVSYASLALLIGFGAFGKIRRQWV